MRLLNRVWEAIFGKNNWDVEAQDREIEQVKRSANAYWDETKGAFSTFKKQCREIRVEDDGSQHPQV